MTNLEGALSGAGRPPTVIAVTVGGEIVWV